MDTEDPCVLPTPRWVTSDTHLGHANILIYCPWRHTWAENIEAHDAAIIAAWNQVVQPDDWVLHLGDFCMGKKTSAESYRKQLQGKICLILGNHDKSRERMLDAGFDFVSDSGEVHIGTRRWYCCHNPHKITIDKMYGIRRVLHGHLHGGDRHREPVPEFLTGIATDCGVDATQSLAPVPWMQVR